MHPVESVGPRDRGSRQRWAAGIASGLILWMSFPPLELSWLAWIALVPLFWLATLRGHRFATYGAAWVGGLVFWALALEWVRLSDPGAWLGWILMALVFSLWWPGFLALVRWARFRLEIPLMVAAPVIWVGLEYSRAYFLSGFPWYYLAHSQYRHLYVIQVADLTGSLGVSLVIAIWTAFMVDMLTLPLLHATDGELRLRRGPNIRLCLVTIVLGSTFCYGAYRLGETSFHDGPRLALLQSNIPQRHKFRRDPAQIVGQFVTLVERAAGIEDKPDLIVWPETSYPYGYIAVDREIDPAALGRQVQSIAAKITVFEWLEKEKVIAEQLHAWTDEVGVPMLIGSTLYEHGKRSIEKYNSAILFRPGRAEIDIYRKMHLVPFGEYVPFVDSMPWLSALTPYERGKVPRLGFGRAPATLALGEFRVAVSICFEDTIPQVIARFFHEAEDGRQPDVLVNLSNDGWFHGSAELDMHLAIGVFRAVEHRVPLARAVNTGLSALVDGNGLIRGTLPKESEGVLSMTVPLDDRHSFYTRHGDWLGLSCLAVTIGLVPIGIVRRPRRRSP